MEINSAEKDSTIVEAVPNKRQPGDTPWTTSKQAIENNILFMVKVLWKYEYFMNVLE